MNYLFSCQFVTGTVHSKSKSVEYGWPLLKARHTYWPMSCYAWPQIRYQFNYNQKYVHGIHSIERFERFHGAVADSLLTVQLSLQR